MSRLRAVAVITAFLIVRVETCDGNLKQDLVGAGDWNGVVDLED